MNLPARAKNRAGEIEEFELTDSVLDYFELLQKFPEVVCLEAIQKIKQSSNKKCALIFGNCQTDKIRRILLNHMQFRREYFFVKLPPVYMFSYELADQILGGGANFSSASICLSRNMLKRRIDSERSSRQKIWRINFATKSKRFGFRTCFSSVTSPNTLTTSATSIPIKIPAADLSTATDSSIRLWKIRA